VLWAGSNREHNAITSRIALGEPRRVAREVVLPPPNERLNLWQAAVQGDLRRVQSCLAALQAAATPSAPFDVDVLSAFGRSALYQACLGQHAVVVRHLLALGASDLDGSAYLTLPDVRVAAATAMRAAGYKGKNMVQSREFRQLLAERRLALAKTMHDRLSAAAPSLLDYDLVHRLAAMCGYRDTKQHNRALQRFRDELRGVHEVPPRKSVATIKLAQQRSAHESRHAAQSREVEWRAAAETARAAQELAVVAAELSQRRSEEAARLVALDAKVVGLEAALTNARVARAESASKLAAIDDSLSKQR
jgi:hypothetical protein